MYCTWESIVTDHRPQIEGPADVGPLINLGTQHDGRSAWTRMKRVQLLFVVETGGQKGLLESTKMDFYET